MKKTLLGFAILSMTTIANAVPNVWEKFDEKGVLVYAISDTKNTTLRVICAYAMPESYDHGVYVDIGNNQISNSLSKQPLSFLVNGSKPSTPTGVTSTVSGSVEWDKITSSFSTAKRIDVYLNNKKITTFNPIQSSMNNIKSLKNCKSRLND
ncbi:hypothetical protein FW754_15365 [Acinetobacter sp. 1207_04]|uniref:hypothetical protein n=1 Tax=Acinetobacter sp. 1207_04 TaxID=2604449 RepID=UPI00405991FE